MNPGLLDHPLDPAVESSIETQQVRILLDNFPSTLAANVLVGLSLVLVASLIGLIASLWTANKLLTTTAFSNLSLKSEQQVEEGFIGVETEQINLVGETGIAHTVLRPSGRVKIHDKLYDAMSEFGFIEKGDAIKVTRYETGQVYVTKT